MKTLIALLMVVLFVAALARAQETPQQMALVKKGRIKMWTGIGLIGAGAFVLLPMATQGKDSSWGSPASTALVFTGGSLIWFGYRDQHKALHPSTTFGVGVGKGTRFHVRRVW